MSMNLADRIINYFSPVSALKRQTARNIIEKREKFLKRGYAAAQTNRMTGDWAPARENINDVIKSAHSTVKNRIQQLCRDFPYFVRAANCIVDYVVGDNIDYQARTLKPNGEFNEKKNKQIEDAFKFWSDECDFSKDLSFSEMNRLAKRQDVETGNFILVERSRREKNRYLPLCFQIIETDWLTDLSTDRIVKQGKNIQTEIKNGIEYDINTGETYAYHFTDPDGWGKVVTVPASQVIHGFETLRPGQKIGISPLVSAVLLSHDFSDFMDSTLDTAKLRSKYLAIVTTSDPYSRQLNLNEDDDGNKLEELENAILEYLRPGENISFPQASIPAVELDPFVRLLLRMLSVAANIPFEILAMDYSGVNFSTAQMSRTDFNFQLEPIIKRHIRQFCNPILKRFINSLYLSGHVQMPGFTTNPYQYYLSEWQAPRSESSTLRDAKSRATEIATGTKSQIEIIKGRGRDPQQVIKEIAAFDKMARMAGLTFGDVSKDMANNPAKVDEQKIKVVK